MKRELDVALASCAELPEHDPDEALLSAALARAGLRSAVLDWNDPSADFAAARMTVLRSTWDYPMRSEEFREWLAATARVSELWNPLPVVLWNLHKRYLLELEARGVPVVATAVLERGSTATLADVKRGRGWGAVVVKPAVSANSFETIRVEEDDLDQGEEHLRNLRARRDVLVQPYLPSVAGYGERAVVCIEGELTHAVRKSPRFGGAGESVSSEPLAITEAEASVANRAIAFAAQKFESRLLYARVDLAPDEAGAPVVMELELIEPSLYLRQSSRALELFVGAIRRRLVSPNVSQFE